MPGLLGLRRAVDHAWRAFQATRYSVLGRVLPELIAEAQLATDELTNDEALAATGLLAQAYQVSTITLLKLGAAELAWLSADRSIDTARRSQDELLVGGSARGLVHALLEHGYYARAKELATGTAAAFESRLGRGSPALLSIYGALLLRGSVAASRQGDRSASKDLLREASIAADLLGADRNCCWTAFGPTNVAVHRVAAAVSLGDGGEAIEQGLAIDLEALTILERRARFLVDLAHGYSLCAKDNEALTTLLKAERLAPEEIRLTPAVREIVGELLRRQRRAGARELRALADRVGALA
ncbi:MAG TPA: XRE family transcriptional regulator [Actinomycetota bacterium]